MRERDAFRSSYKKKGLIELHRATATHSLLDYVDNFGASAEIDAQVFANDQTQDVLKQ